MKTKATLRVRFASSSRSVWVICLLPLTVWRAGSGPLWGYHSWVCCAIGNSLGSLSLVSLIWLSSLNGMLTSLTPTVSYVSCDGPRRYWLAHPNLLHSLCWVRHALVPITSGCSRFRNRQGDLDHYRNVENIWTFYLKNAVIKLENVEHRVDDRLRIIACDGRTPSTGAGTKKAKK